MAQAPPVVGRFVDNETKKVFEYTDNNEDSRFEYPHEIYNDKSFYYGNVMISCAKVVVENSAATPSFETWLILDKSHILYPFSKGE